MIDVRRSILIVISISVAAVAILLWIREFDVSLDQVIGASDDMEWWSVVLIFSMLGVHVALSSWRWSLIEVSLGGPRPNFGYAFTTGAVATGLATILPAPIVSIASRGVANRLSGTSGLRGSVSGTLDQLCDLAAVVLLFPPAAAAFMQHDLATYLWGVLAVLLLGLSIVLLMPHLLSTALSRLRFLDQERADRIANRQLLLSLYGLSLLRVANLTLMTLAIHGSIDDTMAKAIIIGVPLLTLAIWTAMLPGGFGVSEWSFSVLFTSFAIPSTDIVAFAVVNRLLWTGLSWALGLIAIGASLLVHLWRRKTQLM